MRSELKVGILREVLDCFALFAVNDLTVGRGATSTLADVSAHGAAIKVGLGDELTGHEGIMQSLRCHF